MWKTLLENLIPLLVTAITPIVLFFVHQLLASIAKKYKMEAILVYEKQVSDLVEQGILAVEKIALNALKTGANKASSDEKLQSVVEYVNAQLKQLKLPQKPAAQLKKVVEARLMIRAAEATKK